MKTDDSKPMRWGWSGNTAENREYEVHFWFPTSIYIASNVLTPEDNQKIHDRILEIKETTPQGGDSWQCNTYNTLGTYNFANDPVFAKLINLVDEHVYEIVRLSGSCERYSASDVWANVSSENSYQEYHAHALSTFSAVYYVAVPENSGKIWFESPLEPDMLPVKNITNYNPISFRNAHYEPKPGTLIIFRSNLKHMVEINKSTESRISVAFNY